MGVTYSRATLETTLEQLSRLYFTYRRSLTQTAPKKAEEIDASYRRGIAEGMAAFLFLHRSDSLPRFKSLPPIYESDVRAILDAAASDYVNGTPAEKTSLVDGIIDSLLALAVPKELIETDEAERRRLVIAGEEVAKPSDAEWINELAAKKRQEMEELVQLLQPVDLPPKDVDPPIPVV
jgi:hypothetical protein